MLNPELTVPAPGTSGVLENVHLAPFGSPEHERLTDHVKLSPTVLAVTVNAAVLPPVMIALVGEAEMEKSSPVPLSEVVCGLPPNESSPMVSVPVRVPTAIGENRTLTVQLDAGARVDPQVFV
jgi:hypothetical protein